MSFRMFPDVVREGSFFTTKGACRAPQVAISINQCHASLLIVSDIPICDST